MYLIGMLILALIFLGVLTLNKYDSPFSDPDTASAQSLISKSEFDANQAIHQKKLDSTFIKIRNLTSESLSSETKDIRYEIDDVGRTFQSLKSSNKDLRVYDYAIITKFYNMFLEDKGSIINQSRNLKEFQKNYEDCRSGMSQQNQQTSQTNNAYISSGR